MMVSEKAPKASLDGSRPHTCTHGAIAAPVPMPARGPGWWRNYAINCVKCDGEPAGLPYKPGPGLAR